MQILMRRPKTFMGVVGSSARGAKSTFHSCGAPMEPTAAMARQELLPYSAFYSGFDAPVLPHVSYLYAACLVEHRNVSFHVFCVICMCFV